MVVRAIGWVMKHMDEAQLRAVFHYLPFPRSAPNHSFQSSLTLSPSYTRLLTSHHSPNTPQTPILPSLCNSLLSAQTLHSHPLHLLTLIQPSWLCQPHFSSSPRKTRDLYLCCHNTLHTTYTEFPLAMITPLPESIYFQHSFLHFLDPNFCPFSLLRQNWSSEYDMHLAVVHLEQAWLILENGMYHAHIVVFLWKMWPRKPNEQCDEMF